MSGTIRTANPSLNLTPTGGLSPARRSPVSLLRWAARARSWYEITDSLPQYQEFPES
jgi:hypothetical protein